MRPRRLLVRTPLLAVMILQVAVILLAFALAPLLGVTPSAHFDRSAAALLTAVAATAPLVAGFAICSRTQPPWFRELAELVRPTIEALFHRRGHGAIAAVSLACPPTRAPATPCGVTVDHSRRMAPHPATPALALTRARRRTMIDT